MLREPVKIRPGKARQITIEGAGSGTCRSCNLKVSCGQYLLLAVSKPRRFELPESFLPATAGTDRTHRLTGASSAEMSIAGKDLVKFSLLLYMLPLLFVLLAGNILLSESLTIVMTFSVLGLSLFVLHKYIKGQDLQDALNLEL